MSNSLGRVNGMTTTSIPYLLEIERDSLGICLITGDCELDSAEETTRWRSFLSRIDDHYIQATFLPLLVHNDDNPDSPNRFMGLALVHRKRLLSTLTDSITRGLV